MSTNPEYISSLNDCYHPQGTREFDRSSIAGLQKSLNHCHAVNQVLIRENTKLQKKVLRQGLWIKIVGATAAAEWALIVALLVMVLEKL